MRRREKGGDINPPYHTVDAHEVDTSSGKTVTGFLLGALRTGKAFANKLIDRRDSAVAATAGVLLLSGIAPNPAAAETTDDIKYEVTAESSSSASFRWKGRLVEWYGTRISDDKENELEQEGKCKTTDGWNYYASPDGSPSMAHGRHWDENMRLCKVPKGRDKGESPTRWIKVGGGHTGSPCDNYATPEGEKPLKKHPVFGNVTEVRSIYEYLSTQSANASAEVTGTKVCPDGSIYTASASGDASVKERQMYKMIRETKGSAKEFRNKLNAKSSGDAEADAKVGIVLPKCDKVETPPLTPENNAPLLQFEGTPAHMTWDTTLPDGGMPNVKVFVMVKDPDGDPISYSLTAEGAGYIAGVTKNDTKQDLTPCPEGWTCVSGTIWGTEPGEVVVTASATDGENITTGQVKTYVVTKTDF